MISGAISLSNLPVKWSCFTDTYTGLLKTAFILFTPRNHHVLQWWLLQCSTNAAVQMLHIGFPQNPFHMKFSHSPGSFEMFKHFTAVLSGWSEIGAWRVDLQVHIHFDIHKPGWSMSCIILHMHVLVGVSFSAWKNRVEKTVVQKFILLQNWHSSSFPFTLLPTEQWFQYLFHYQTYHWCDHVSQKYFNRSAENSTYNLRHH